MDRKRHSDEGNSPSPAKKTCLADAGCSSRQRISSAEHDRRSKRNVDLLSEDHCRNQKRLHQPESSIIPCQAGTSLTSNCNEKTTAGRILRVVLKNFMCHEHLRVTFNDRITFVCGKNGSGKSAILTAIVVGLGGRGTDANRGDLKHLLRSGSSYGSIEITLSNIGFSSFKPELYGDEITVLRSLTESSHNRVTGKTVANVKSELNKMLITFGIQINNPVTILNQDMARNFLKNSKPAELYKFFSWTLDLSDIEKQLIENESTVSSVKKSLEVKEKELEFSSRDVLEIKRKRDMKEVYDELKKKIAVLKNELNWARVSILKFDMEKKKKNFTQSKELQH